MDLLDVARATTDPVRTIPARFMMHEGTRARGKELGFVESDFYFTGRGGVLGDVDADVVTAAFAFVEAGTMRTAWERGRVVLPRQQASVEYVGCLTEWARTQLPSDFPSERCAELLHTVTAAADCAGAPLFAGWRALPAPTDAAARMIFELNLLRELRGARHITAVLSAGIRFDDAVRERAIPFVTTLFGWNGEIPADRLAELEARRGAAEDHTNQLLAPAFAVLSPAERTELVELLNRLAAVLA